MQPLGKTVGGFSKIKSDPAVPLLGIYPEKTLIWKDTCTSAFTAIGKSWKHPKCPSTEEQIKKMWYIYTVYPITSWQIDGEKIVTDFIFLGSKKKSLQTVTAATKLKDACSSEEKL